MKKTQRKSSVVACLAVLFVIGGCGLKANPAPVQHIIDYRMIVKDMQAIPSDGAVTLKWNFHDADEIINYISIERSEAGTAGNECKNCPRTFERINQMQIKGAVPDNKAPGTLSYSDKNVVKGKNYNYRLILCGDAGVCQEASAVEIDYQ